MADHADFQTVPAKNTQTNAFIFEVCSVSLISLIMAILFGVFTSNPRYYGDESTCTDLLLWGKRVYYLFVAEAIFFGLINPLLFCSMVCWASEFYYKISTFSLYFVRIGFLLASLIVFIAVSVSFGENEPCGDLRTLTAVYIILIAISISLILCGVCCFVCCAAVFGGAMAGMSSAINNDINNTKHYDSFQTGNDQP